MKPPVTLADVIAEVKKLGGDPTTTVFQCNGWEPVWDETTVQRMTGALVVCFDIDEEPEQ